MRVVVVSLFTRHGDLILSRRRWGDDQADRLSYDLGDTGFVPEDVVLGEGHREHPCSRPIDVQVGDVLTVDGGVNVRHSVVKQPAGTRSQLVRGPPEERRFINR